MVEEEPDDPLNIEASSDTQTTESSTLVAVPTEQSLVVMLRALWAESFRKKLYCVDVTIRLLMLLPAMFKKLRFVILKITDGNSVNLLFDKSKDVMDGRAKSKVAIELSDKFNVVKPCRASETELSESVMLVMVFLLKLTVRRFLFARLPNCEGKLAKLQFSIVSSEIVVGRNPVGSDPRSKLVKINCSSTLAVENVS